MANIMDKVRVPGAERNGKVLLTPFLRWRGDHANNDMAGGMQTRRQRDADSLLPDNYRRRVPAGMCDCVELGSIRLSGKCPLSHIFGGITQKIIL